MLIAIDHGNKQVKTVHGNAIVSGVQKSKTRPYGRDILKYGGSYYTLSAQRIPYQKDKTTDERFFILSLFAIAEEIENEFIQKFNLYLDQTLFSQKLDHPLPLLKRFEQFILNDEDDCRMLVHTQNYPIFLEKLKKLFIDRLVANIDDEPSRDKCGFLVFVHVLASGLIELYTLYLKSEIDLSLAQVNEEINKMFLAGLRLYQ